MATFTHGDSCSSCALTLNGEHVVEGDVQSEAADWRSVAVALPTLAASMSDEVTTDGGRHRTAIRPSRVARAPVWHA